MTLHSHCFSSCCLAQDALHNGRYGSEVQLCLCLDGFAGDDTARAVSLLRRQAQDARHQGQYGSEVHLFLCLDGFAGEDAARAVSLLRRQAQDARHQGRYGSEEQLCRDTEALARCVQRHMPMVQTV